MNTSNPDKLVGLMWFGVHGYGRSMPGVMRSAVHLLKEQKEAGDRLGNLRPERLTAVLLGRLMSYQKNPTNQTTPPHTHIDTPWPTAGCDPYSKLSAANV